MPMRMSGLASGMDIEALVTQMMTARRAPVDKQLQNKQVYEWQRDSYREMNTMLTEFRDNMLSNSRLSAPYLAKSATVTGNTTAVTVKANATASNGTLQVEVLDTATAATSRSTKSVLANAAVPIDTRQPLAGEAAKLRASLSETTYSFKINGKEIAINVLEDSMDDVIRKINRETNVSAFYDEQTGHISFMAKETGLTNGANKNEAHITFSDVKGNFLGQVMSVFTGGVDPQSPQPGMYAEAAVNAKVKVNGLETTRTSNTFTVNGVELSLHAKSDSGDPSMIRIETNVDAVVDHIKSFVSSYNDILKKVYDKTTETRYRDFSPLTDEQKKAMKEDDIKRWQEKAMSGLLRSDSILTSTYQMMRSAAGSRVETGSNEFRTLSSIGITTGSYTENGKLYIDEKKLREAIAKDPDAIAELFAGVGDEEQGNNGGIARQMYNGLEQTLKELKTKAGFPNMLKDDSTLSKRIGDLDKWIKRETDRLQDFESNLYRQFTAMEQAINKFNSQSAYLQNAFQQA